MDRTTWIHNQSVGLFIQKHHEVTNAGNIEEHFSQERVFRWIAKKIDIDG